MKITFILQDQQEKTVQAQAGMTLLEVAESQGVPLFGGCGGSGICGSCRVRLEVLDPVHVLDPEEEELETLEALQSDEGVRLACQIRLTEGCDGLRVHLLA